jgi:WD40 repeat protein
LLPGTQAATIVTGADIMAETFDYDVFLSYSSKDRNVVHALAEKLRNAGLRVWLDSWVIQPGDPISLKIQHGLEKSRVLLMCMSKAYFRSGWAGLEHHSLLFRDPTNKERRFIPVLVGECKLPSAIAQFAYVDWREPSGEAYDTLLKACRPEPSKRKREPGRARRGQQPPGGSEVVRTLKGHSRNVMAVAVTPDGRRAVSGSWDETLKVWDLEQGALLATLGDHGLIYAVAVTPDGRRAVSGSSDRTVKVWDLEQGALLSTLEGHGDEVNAVAVTPDGRRAVSGSDDRTLKVWDLEQGALLATLKSHGEWVRAVAVTPDGRRAVSGSHDWTLKVWNLPPPDVVLGREEPTRYTNAKLALVGESGVGKTGLTIRLAENDWRETSSTHGMNVWQLELPRDDTSQAAHMEREAWLWDFAGQPDYRLIHQLYMDETALALMVFDPQKDRPFEPLGHWGRR